MCTHPAAFSPAFSESSCTASYSRQSEKFGRNEYVCFFHWIFIYWFNLLICLLMNIYWISLSQLDRGMWQVLFRCQVCVNLWQARHGLLVCSPTVQLSSLQKPYRLHQRKKIWRWLTPWFGNLEDSLQKRMCVNTAFLSQLAREKASTGHLQEHILPVLDEANYWSCRSCLIHLRCFCQSVLHETWGLTKNSWYLDWFCSKQSLLCWRKV